MQTTDTTKATPGVTSATPAVAVAATAAADSPMIALWNRCAGFLDSVFSHSFLAIVNRLGIAGVFFLSGRTKVDGLLTVNESAYALFRDEYRLPLLPPELAAHLAAYAEHLFPILLVLGLCTRLSAFALLMMTAVIQVFVYPMAWATHLSWAGLLLYLVARGGGKMSADHWLRIR
jgi:putative oxidoreductase